MKISLLPCLFLLFMLTACEKENPTTIDNTPAPIIGTTPWHWTLNGNAIGDVVYDEMDRLVHVRRYDTPDRFELEHFDAHTEFTYEGASNRLATARWATWGDHPKNAVYHYSGNQLDSIIVRTDGGDYKDQYLFEHDEQQTCSLKSYTCNHYQRIYEDGAHKFVLRDSYLDIFEYFGDNCSHVNTRYKNGNFSSKVKKEIGDKTDFFYSLSFEKIAFPFMYEKAVVKQCALNENGTMKSCIEPILEYNEKNYLTKRTFVSDSTNTVLEYFYK